MRAILRPLLLLLASAGGADPGVTVRLAQGRIDVAAARTPLADVLDQVARQTGMKVVYEGPAPRQLVTLALVGRSPAEAVSAILEGQGLNYALILDATATRVEKLLVTGPTPTGPSRAVAVAPRHVPLPDPEPEPEDLPEEPPPVPEPAPPVPVEAPTPPSGPTPGAQPFPTAGPLPPGMSVVPPVLPPAPPGPTPFGPTPQPTPTPPATPP
jgi:hypothetical protein